MTMFTRNDKAPDQTGDASTSPSSTAAAGGAVPTPSQTTPPRNHAIAQPITHSGTHSGAQSGAQSSARASASASAPYASAPQPQMVSVISKALKITGQLESTEDIQIDGEIDGDIRGLSVKVGSNAKVKGTVYGDAVELAGTVNGKIEAKSVVLTSTAHMSGDVVHQEIRIETGAYIDGHCKPDYGTSKSQRASASTGSSNGAAKSSTPEKSTSAKV